MFNDLGLTKLGLTNQVQQFMFNDSILCQIMSYFSSFKIMSNELNLETHNVRYYQRITIKQKFKESLPEFIFTKTWKINI